MNIEKNIPNFLYRRLLNQYGEEITDKIIQGYSKQRKVTLRVNTIKTDINTIKSELKKAQIEYKEVAWNSTALIIENAREEQIKKLKIYEDGEIYLQSLSSMIPSIILEPKANDNILDMTAAPGGKTTQMAAISQNKAIITACEKNKIRAERLKYNLQKQGVTCTYVMNTDSRKLDNYFSFDKILLDAPCSGSGTIYTNDNIQITEELIYRSIKTQEELLQKALKILKNGGEIIYSTCSILLEENEKILEKVLQKSNVQIIPIKFEGVSQLPTTIKGTICVLPTELYEGFFVAKIKVTC